jgi:CubicO group peptidase (beta-lactamase class C family)
MNRSFARTLGWAVLLSLSTVGWAPLSTAATLVPPAPNFSRIDAYVIMQMQAMHIPGVALGIVHGDQIVHLQGFGQATPAGHPVTPHTPLILGSTSKSFTALAIMQLVEAGRIHLDAPVQRYLPWFQVGTPAAAATITVRQLLHHVSGIPTRAVETSLTGTGAETLEQQVRALREVALSAPVGRTYQYSNLNYATLGLIVQTVAGQSYEAYVQQQIFAPLQMARSFGTHPAARAHGLATGYRWWFGLPLPADLLYLRGSVPAGFLISSAEDLTHYLIAQLNAGRYGGAAVLSPGGIAQLHQPAAAMDAPGVAYGMGWVIRAGGEPAIWHGGDTANFHSDLILLPQQRWGVVVLMNVNGELARQTNAQGVIAEGIRRLLLGQSPPAASTFALHYLVFDGAIVGCALLGLGSLVRLLRQRQHPPRRRPWRVRTPRALPLLWEVGLPLTILLGVPTVLQAPWPLALLYFPDLGYFLLVLCLLLVATGTLRLILARAVPRAGGATPGPDPGGAVQAQGEQEAAPPPPPRR